MRHLSSSIILFAALLLVSGCSSAPKTSALRQPAAAVDPRYDYQRMSDLALEVMLRKTARDFLSQEFADALKVTPEIAAKYGFLGTKLDGFTETQVMTLLRENPDLWDDLDEYIKAVPRGAKPVSDTPQMKATRALWKKRFQEIFSDPKRRDAFLENYDPLAPFVLEMPNNGIGYRNPAIFVSHPTLDGNSITPADDLEKQIVGFIQGAKKEIILNVFDFDLNSVADALVAKRKAGLTVQVGIDSGVVKTRPEVKAIFDKLQVAGVAVHAVDSVGLNHQKLIATDWSLPGKGRAFVSSGNFTQSCVSAKGDLTGTNLVSDKAIPNANHTIIIDSDPFAIMIHHELVKTVDPSFALRGRDYPLSGIFEIMGDMDGDTRRWVMFAFTPNGAWNDISENFIARMLIDTEGPVSMAQFAYSSKIVNDALVERAKREIANGTFQFQLVSEVPSAMAAWSQALHMAGLKLVKDPSGKKQYVKLSDTEDQWLQALGPAETEKLRQSLLNAPAAYGTFSIPGPNGDVQVTAKLHHKLMITGSGKKELAVTGSFNFSVGAESNQEIITAWNDSRVVKRLKGAIAYLVKKSRGTIAAEAAKRNKFGGFGDDNGPDVEAAKAGRGPKLSRPRGR